MLYQTIQSVPVERLDEPVVVCADLASTWRDLRRGVQAMLEQLASLAGRAVALAMPFGPDWLAAAAALDRLECQCFLLPAGLSRAEITRHAGQFQLAAILLDKQTMMPGSASAAARSAGSPHSAGRVVLLTSGTSGGPKAAMHTWASLASGIHVSDKLRGWRMLLSYDVARYAGVQVLLTALLNGAALCVPPSRQMPDIVRTIVQQGVQFVSGTPTFWRMLLANSGPEHWAKMPLRQVTLGGEIVNQPLLDALRAAFPAARITHIYASTEMGVCFSVHDCREGFPADFLDSDSLPVRLKARDGRLWIRSKRSMEGYLAGSGGPAAGAVEQVRDRWFDTGDAVEVVGDRVFFRGRESSRINVGGEKVYPEEVESIIRQAAGVAEVRVSGADSSIMGQLVQADIVPAAGADEAELRRRIERFCRERLPAFKRPRLINFVKDLAQSDTLKISRRTDNT